jgi:hypothetical protein
MAKVRNSLNRTKRGCSNIFDEDRGNRGGHVAAIFLRRITWPTSRSSRFLIPIGTATAEGHHVRLLCASLCCFALAAAILLALRSACSRRSALNCRPADLASGVEISVAVSSLPNLLDFRFCRQRLCFRLVWYSGGAWRWPGISRQNDPGCVPLCGDISHKQPAE